MPILVAKFEFLLVQQMSNLEKILLKESWIWCLNSKANAAAYFCLRCSTYGLIPQLLSRTNRAKPRLQSILTYVEMPLIRIHQREYI